MASAGCGAAARVPLETRASALGFQRSAPHVWSRWGAVGDQAFLEVVIGTDDVDAPLPLVVALHGFGDAPRVPEQPYLSMRRAFRIILPRGPIALGNGFAWSAIRVRDGRPDDLATAIGAALPRVLATLDTVRSVRPTRGSPIVVGFSQGGIVALALAAAHPQRVGLVLPMAAWLPPALEPGPTPAAPPVRAIHPRDDERIPLAPTEALVARLRAAGWHATLEVVEGTHAMSPAIEAFVARELDRALADRE
jgi:phospholipase/carboxylesterase